MKGTAVNSNIETADRRNRNYEFKTNWTKCKKNQRRNASYTDKLFDNPSNRLSFDDKVLLQQIYQLLGDRKK